MFDAPTQRILPSARLCRVHLFRHGEVEGPRGRVCRGQTDDPLSATGLTQTRAVAAWAATAIPRPDAVVASDLSRCATLAHLLGPARLEPALREQAMGAWDGRTWEDITVEDPEGTLAY